MTDAVTTHIRQTIAAMTEPAFIRKMAWALVFFAMMLVILYFNIQFMKSEYPEPIRPDDLLLDLLPEMTEFIVIGEVMAIFGLSLSVLILAQGHFQHAPRLLFIVTLMFLLRAFTLPLTPLAQIQPPAENYTSAHIIAHTFYEGMYFSGHTASAFIFAFFFKGHRLRPLLFVLAFGQGLSLLLSHSHYSIDIVGGFFVAYFVTHFDFMRLVPKPLLRVRWLPWYDAGSAPPRRETRPAPGGQRGGSPLPVPGGLQKPVASSRQSERIG
jgi:membrane-associated phospholipid phosphatase